MSRVSRNELVGYCDQFLNADLFQDYCPNGLQVEGKAEIGTLVSGVTACQALVEAAIEAGADALLVHHGYFWKGEDPRVVGMKQRRLKRLLQHDISLIAYHLPLDAHPRLGNNARLAAMLGLEVEGGFAGKPGAEIAVQGRLSESLSGAALAERLQSLLGRQVLHEPGGPEVIRKIGICSGGAQGYIEQAAALGLDAYITGEVSEQTIHIARECGIHFYAAGHHATERYGVQALGEHLAERFGIEHRFIDIDNPA